MSSVPAASSTSSKRVILVHGTGHGGWCWYRVATLLRAAGHRVDAPDLVASGADAHRLRDAPTFEDYTRPLLDALRALPEGERAVLVGHSFGGMSVALAAEEFPEKVAAAVFVTAFMPDCTNPRPYVIETTSILREVLSKEEYTKIKINLWIYSKLAEYIQSTHGFAPCVVKSPQKNQETRSSTEESVKLHKSSFRRRTMKVLQIRSRLSTRLPVGMLIGHLKIFVPLQEFICFFSPAWQVK